MESHQNEATTHFGVIPLFLIRAVSLSILQSCCQLDADSWCKRALHFFLCFTVAFRLTVTKAGAFYGEGSFYFVVDETRVAFKYLWVPSDSAAASSATLNIEPTAGQIVTVENDGVTATVGTGDEFSSWFTGHLLYAL